MNTCCRKNARGLMVRLSRLLDKGETELSGGCSRCGAYMTVRIEGAN